MNFFIKADKVIKNHVPAASGPVRCKQEKSLHTIKLGLYVLRVQHSVQAQGYSNSQKNEANSFHDKHGKKFNFSFCLTYLHTH